MRKISTLSSTFCLLSAFVFAAESAADQSHSSTSATNGIVVLQGRVAPAAGSSTNLLFKTGGGAIYKLTRSPAAEALFLDTNLYSKMLLLKGKVLPEKKTFEVMGNLHSLKNGKAQKLYYYCDVCAISSTTPGLCQCCRDPVKLVEEPEEAVDH
jgi:hypothetical protein